VWASDCIDPHERQQIQRWTAQLVPPELIGAHVGADRAHTTGRVHDLGFRAATALFGHLGIEWDLTAATSDELAELAAWVVFAKEMRELLHHGVTVRGDLPGDMWLHGVVSESRDEALYCVVALGRPITWPPGRMTLPGLDADRIYEVRPVGPQRASGGTRVDPGWWDAPLRLPGSVLLAAGIQVPALDPDQAALLYVREVEA
jgi:alpha-galactosidase